MTCDHVKLDILIDLARALHDLISQDGVTIVWEEEATHPGILDLHIELPCGCSTMRHCLPDQKTYISTWLLGVTV